MLTPVRWPTLLAQSRERPRGLGLLQASPRGTSGFTATLAVVGFKSAAHTLRLVEVEIAAGRISGIEPEPTVRALIAMNLQYFFDELVDNPAPDVDAVARTLTTVWGRALYGRAR